MQCKGPANLTGVPPGREDVMEPMLPTGPQLHLTQDLGFPEKGNLMGQP